MINNVNNVLNQKLRLTGMASGLDTDMIIKQMMYIEQMKVDKIKQDKQVLEWKRDDYRSITNSLRAFKDEFFDIINPDNYMPSSNAYFAYKVTSSNENVATASGNSQVSMFEHEINVTKLAEAARLETYGVDEEGVTRFGEAGLTLNSTVSQVAARFDLELIDNKLSFEINDNTIELDANANMEDLMKAINDSNANVKISYSEFLDKFTMTTKTTGVDSKINIEDDIGFFNAIGFTELETVGKDAEFKLDGKEATRSSNIFTIDGVTYTLKEEGTTKITLSQDTDAVFDKIKGFVDKYNELVDKITTKINEERPKSGGRYGSYYLPLTDEQKAEMKDADIEKWEENAKKGLLKNDAILDGILFDLRRAMGDMTEGGTLASIGISTGDWREGAKLFISEEKLKKAISDNPDKVMDIFSKQSNISYSVDATAAERKQRYEESGIVERLSDILQDNIRTTRDKDGRKGVLLEKAGIVGDITEFHSSLVEEINKKDTLIEEMMRRLLDKEESLYKKFAGLESALSRMMAQSAWMAQAFGGGQQ